MATVWQVIGTWSAAAFLAAVVFAFLARPMVAFADSVARTVRQSPLSALVGALFLAVCVAFAGEKPTPPGPMPPPEPGRQPQPEASNWEWIDLDAEHAIIENEDKSRQNAVIPVETEGDVVVPDVLKLHRVVSIGTRAFYDCSRITSVDIPEGVTNIADYAFYNCSSLTNVVFPSTLKSIGAYAFVGCGQLKQLHIEVPRLLIGERAFRDCDGLQTIRFAGDELIVATRAFFGCGGLRDVNLSVKDITLSEGAFSGGYDSSHYGYCDHLTNVLVTASNRVDFGVSVFRGTSSLRQAMLIAGSAMNVGSTAFVDCSALQQVAFRAGAGISVGSTAFSGCIALRQATLTAGSVMNVGASAFSVWKESDSITHSSCNHLTNVLITASNRVELGSSAFSGCTALQQVSLAAPEPSSFGDSVFSNCKALQVIELPEGLVGVPQNAFYCCSSLQSVSLSSNVTSIAYRAFDTCTSLTNVWLKEGLSVIESQAFYGCALKRLELPQSVSSVGSRAFEECGDLETVLVREGDTNLYEAAALALGERAFYRCDALATVRLPQRATVLPARVFADCECLTSINLPSNLTDIAESAFESCAALPYVDFPTSLASIGAMAFNSCAALTGFGIPTNRIVDLGDKAFVGTKYWNEWPDGLVENNGYILGFKGNPTSVELPEGCVAIPAEMFMGMAALTNVVVPASVKKVGLRAFAGSGLQTVELPKVTELGVSAFEGCANLTAIVLAEGLGQIPNLAFHGCSSLLAVDIPKSVVSIGAEAFRDCVALRDVTGGEGVLSVDDYAFAGCVRLQPFRFPQDVAYGEHVFQGVRWTENVLFPSVGTMAQEYPQTYAEIKSVVVSSTQTGIVDRACAGCASLELVVLPDGVRHVGASAFEGCVALTSVVLSVSVSNVGSNAFKGCSSIISLATSGDFVVRDVFPESYATMKSVKIASGVTSLCDNMLEGCAAIASIELPKSLSEIGAFAFAGCKGLQPGITIPEEVTSIGDYAFKGCIGLSIVRYMGEMPEANPNIYSGTKESLVSGVRKKYEESWTVSAGTNGTSRTLPERWPQSPSNRVISVSSRRIAWWSGPSDAGETTGAITFYYYDATGGKGTFGPEDWLDEPPDEREGYEFAGWWTKPYGGIRVESAEDCIALGVTAVYAHWVRQDSDDDPWEWGDVLYDLKRSHAYDGYLLDGDAVVGTIQVKMSKGKANRKTEETTVSVTAKAVLLGEGKSISFKGVSDDISEDGGTCDMVCTRKSDKRELSVAFAANELVGSLDGYNVVAARNMFPGKTDWDKRRARAALEDWGDPRVVVLKASGGSPMANGYAVLTVQPGSKGKVKVKGALPDGTKVSVTTRMLIGEPDGEGLGESCEIPVFAPLYARKAGGFGFLIRMSEASGIVVTGISEWIANPGRDSGFTGTLEPVGEVGSGIGIVGALTSGSRFSLEDVFEPEGAKIDFDLLPDCVPVAVSGKKWTLPKADKVKFVKDEGYVITKDYGNPSGLKLTYAASKGTFKGRFKVYAVTETGKAKKYTANVTGAVLDEVGYGTAIIKNLGSVPVIIMAAE